MTTGLLEWGQSGSYNAPDDRRVITALSAGRSAGVVNPVVLTAGSGLNVQVAAGWLAVVNCQDGTYGVIGTASALTVPGAAGDPGAPRTDSLWADCSPTAGTFSLVIIPQSAETGRLGMRLATITVPTNANLASAFTLTPVTASFANFPNGLNLGAGGTMWTLTPESPAGYLKLQQGANPPLYLSDTTGMLYAANPASLGQPDIWHVCTLSGGWTHVASQGLTYTLLPDDTVHLHGQMTVPSGATGPPTATSPWRWSRPCHQAPTPALSTSCWSAHPGCATCSVPRPRATCSWSTCGIQSTPRSNQPVGGNPCRPHSERSAMLAGSAVTGKPARMPGSSCLTRHPSPQTLTR